MLETVKRISAGGECSQLEAVLSGGKRCPAEPELYRVHGGGDGKFYITRFRSAVTEHTTPEQIQQLHRHHGSR